MYTLIGVSALFLANMVPLLTGLERRVIIIIIIADLTAEHSNNGLRLGCFLGVRLSDCCLR